MSKTIKTILIIVGVVVLIVAYWTIDNFVYPVKSVHPNYTDVERAFSQLQFPTDWKEISSSENRGLHGRDCDPFNKAGCFHKSKTFKVPENITENNVQQVLAGAGCTNIITRDITLKGDLKPTKTLNCGLGGGLSIGADLTGPTSQLYVAAETY